jgi:hypothetical protein
MAVPGASTNYLRSTTVGTAGSFSAQTQGGTLLGNAKTSTPASPIENLLPLKDNATAFPYGPRNIETANGLIANQKALSAGSFGYEEAGKYVLMTISDTLSGVSKNNMLIPGADNGDRRSIHQFHHDFGADVTSLMRANRFSRTGFFNNGNKISSRYLWLNAAGTAVAAPSTLTGNVPWAPGGAARGGTPANAADTDSAANPTRSIPGRLVMERTWVKTNLNAWTHVDGNYFTYKSITGM